MSAESDLTVQLKEQLNLNTQAPGVHLHRTELNTDRTRLRKEWEKAHGEPNDVHILKPGADYEERYVSKKIPGNGNAPPMFLFCYMTKPV